MSDEIISRWHGERVVGYALNQCIHVPGKARMLRAVAEVLPFPRNWDGQILELAAGQGALSEVLLRRFPRCRMTLLDASAEMLDLARRNLAGFGDRVSFILADLMGQGWLARLAPPYGAVVSSLAFHYVGADARPAAFGTIHGLLGDGGWFVDADLFDCECGEITKRIERVSAGHARRQMRLLRGESVSLDEMVARRGACSAQSGHCRSTVAAETAQLRAAGFAAGCVWQEWCIAVIAARKSSGGA